MLKEISKVVGTSRSKSLLTPNRHTTSSSKRPLTNQSQDVVITANCCANKNDVRIAAQATNREPKTPSTDLCVDIKSRETTDVKNGKGRTLKKDKHNQNAMIGYEVETINKTLCELSLDMSKTVPITTLISGKTHTGELDIHQPAPMEKISEPRIINNLPTLEDIVNRPKPLSVKTHIAYPVSPELRPGEVLNHTFMIRGVSLTT